MLLVQGLLLLCSLFAVGTCTCYSINLDPTDSETCFELFKEFESALKTNFNLFHLEELFNPTLNTVPSLAKITYVQYYNMSPEVEPCPKSSRDNSSSIDVTTDNTTELGWSTSGVYDVISPIVLHVLQPQLLRALMEIIRALNGGLNKGYNHNNRDLDALLWVGKQDLTEVKLYLNNLSLHCIPSINQVNSLLLRITSKLTTYPHASEVSTGYAIEKFDSSAKLTTYLYFGLIQFLSIATCLIAGFTIKHLVQNTELPVKTFLDNKNVQVAAYGMLFYAFAECASDIGLNGLWYNANSNVGIFGTKLALVLIIVFLIILFRLTCCCCFCCLCCSKCCYDKCLKNPSDKFLKNPYDEPLENIFKFILPFFALLTFAYYILTTTMTFIMLVFIYPMWASSLLLLITVIFFTVYIHIYFIVPIICNHCTCTQEQECTCKSCGNICIIILMIFWSLLVIGFFSVYLFIFELFIIYARGVSSGDTAKTILYQLIPSVFLVFVLWLIRIMPKIASDDNSGSPPQEAQGTSEEAQEEAQGTAQEAQGTAQEAQGTAQEAQGTPQEAQGTPQATQLAQVRKETQNQFELNIQEHARGEREPLLNTK